MTDESSEAKPAAADSPFRLSLLKDPLEVLAKAAAALLVIFYIFGFLVVSAANYKHGITNFGLFRVRVVSAGVVVALFIGAAFWLWEGVFGLGLPGRKHINDGKPLSLKLLIFLIAVTFTAHFLNSVMFPPHLSIYSGWRLLLYLVGVGLITAPPGFMRKHPAIASILRWVFIVVFVALEARFQWRRGVDFIFLWFVFFAMIADATKKSLKQVSTIRDVNWLILVFDMLLIPFVFGLFLFERIPPRFGGGQPVAVVFQFAGTSPIDGVVKDKFWLVDEGDSGFYVLQAPEDKKGIFLPRASVAAIYYDAARMRHGFLRSNKKGLESVGCRPEPHVLTATAGQR
jgi:hypothetical protein